MIKKLSNKETYSTRRIEALSDGVFAIAMTLLVLGLDVPKLSHNADSYQLWLALKDMRVSFYNFVVSFLILGSMWGIHLRQFELIVRTDRKLIMLNTLRLLVVVLIPFSASISGDYSNNALGRLLLPLNLLALAIVSYIQWVYAANNANLYAQSEPRSFWNTNLRNLSFIAIAAIVCIAAIFVGSLAYLGFLMIPLIMFFVSRFARKI